MCSAGGSAGGSEDDLWNGSESELQTETVFSSFAHALISLLIKA